MKKLGLSQTLAQRSWSGTLSWVPRQDGSQMGRHDVMWQITWGQSSYVFFLAGQVVDEFLELISPQTFPSPMADVKKANRLCLVGE